MTKWVVFLIFVLFSILENTYGYVFGPIIDRALLFSEEYTTYIACQAASPALRLDVEEHKKIPGAPLVPIGREDINFLLFTKQNPDFDSPQILNLDSTREEIQASNYNFSNPTQIYIHGLNQTYINAAIAFTQNIIPRRNMNVLICDWDKYSLFLPQTYSINITIPRLGKLISMFVNNLIDAGADPKQFHLIGFSAGAQAVGLAGKLIDPKVARISAWDPEGNCFNFLPPGRRIAKTDADFVEIVHCSLGVYATRLGIFGDLTFYMNGGIIQPQCEHLRSLYDLSKCSHQACAQYMFTWLLGDDSMMGQKCRSYLDYMFGDCECKNQISLSLDVPNTIFGTYYVDTVASLTCKV